MPNPDFSEFDDGRGKAATGSKAGRGQPISGAMTDKPALAGAPTPGKTQANRSLGVKKANIHPKSTGL